MQISIFGKTLTIEFGEHKHKQTETTFIPLPNPAPRESLRKINEHSLRKFSRTAVVNRAISLIRDGVLSQKFNIVPLKKHARIPIYAINAIERIIDKPNEHDSFRSFWGQLINETLIGDNGAAEIVFNGSIKKPLNLYPVNGFSLEYVTGFFTEKNYPRFCQKINADRIYLYDNDIFYLQKNKSADNPFGLSPVESAFREIDYLLNAQAYAGRTASNAVSKTIIDLGESVSKEDLAAFRKYFTEEVQGSGETAIIGGTKGASTLVIGADSDNALFLEWQKHLISIISLAFAIDPKKLNQGSNTDRSTVEEQNENILLDAIRPYCLLIQDEINRKIIARLGLDDVLKFEFYFEDTLEQKAKRQKLFSEQWINSGITLNEYRDSLGLDPIDGEFGNMTQAELKSALNKKYAVQSGGFNGLGKNQKENVQKKLKK